MLVNVMLYVQYCCDSGQNKGVEIFPYYILLFCCDDYRPLLTLLVTCSQSLGFFCYLSGGSDFEVVTILYICIYNIYRYGIQDG